MIFLPKQWSFFLSVSFWAGTVLSYLSHLLTHRPHLKQDYESFAEQWPRVVIGRWQIRLWEKESTSSFNFVALHIRT